MGCLSNSDFIYFWLLAVLIAPSHKKKQEFSRLPKIEVPVE
jgi:hypothetical protein